eukprot:snap_masked-scaffold_48-processed-gene-1.118-mRNA-1 protein AED:1.00 eAED:1.00 QI:0/0/0/0/1/1/2/0/67
MARPSKGRFRARRNHTVVRILIIDITSNKSGDGVKNSIARPEGDVDMRAVNDSINFDILCTLFNGDK